MKLPILQGKPQEVHEGELPILLPHDLWSFLLTHHFAHAEKSILQTGVAAFWETIREDDPMLRGHPVLQRDDYKNLAAPLRLHGDGVQFTKKGNMMVHGLEQLSLQVGVQLAVAMAILQWGVNCPFVVVGQGLVLVKLVGRPREQHLGL